MKSASAKQLLESRTQQFRIFSHSYAGLRVAAELSRKLEQFCKNYFPLGFTPTPIELVLLESQNSKPPFILREGTLGAVRVEVYWSDTLRRKQFCRALTEALLKHVGQKHFGKNPKIPKWMLNGLARWLELQAYPAFENLQRESLMKASIPSFQAFLNGSTAEPDASLSLWFWDFLASQMPESRLRHQLFLALLSSADNSWSVLQKAFPNACNDVLEAEIWWMANLQGALDVPVRALETMKLSQRNLGFFKEISMVGSSGYRRVQSSDWWLERQTPAFRQLLLRRHGVLSEYLTRINPVYYNACLSLGVFIEAVLANRETAAKDALNQFERDFKRAQETENNADRELQRLKPQ